MCYVMNMVQTTAGTLWGAHLHLLELTPGLLRTNKRKQKLPCIAEARHAALDTCKTCAAAVLMKDAPGRTGGSMEAQYDMESQAPEVRRMSL